MPDLSWVTDPDVLGISRSLDPPGTLLHPAARIDAETDPNDFEIALEVELLNIDATSFRELAARSEGDPSRIAQLIRDIVFFSTATSFAPPRTAPTRSAPGRGSSSRTVARTTTGTARSSFSGGTRP